MRIQLLLAASLAIGASACLASEEEPDFSCMTSKCDSANYEYRGHRQIAVRVHAAFSQTEAFGRGLWVASILDDIDVEEQDALSFQDVEAWVCDVSEPADYLNANLSDLPDGERDDIGKRWQKETKDLFGCGWFNDAEITFIVDAYQNEEFALWHDRGEYYIGHLDDYPGNY